MWCSLNQAVVISPEQIEKINAYLIDEAHETGNKEQFRDEEMPSEDETEKEVGVEQWSQQMEVDSSEKSDTEGSVASDSRWLKHSLVSLSNTLDVMAIANVNRVIVLERSSTNSQHYDICGKIDIVQNLRPNEFITALHVLPVATTRKTEVAASDWSVIIVGLSNGYVNFYTERGALIFFEKISSGFIKAVRFGQSALKGNQELVFLSRSQLIVIEGLSLFNTLRLARSQIARGDMSLDEVTSTLELNARILRVNDLNNIYDFSMTGLKKPSSFEQYSTASMTSQGIYASIRPGLPTYSTYFCTARDAFGAFVWHNFYEKQTNVADMVSNLANSVTSNISAYVPSIGFRSYFGLGTSRKDKPTKTAVCNVSVETAYTRQCCRDKGRLGDRLFVAPKPWNILAVADQNARILIFDTETRRIIRMFKGYRNARCAFVETSGKVRECRRAVKALFLIIFAPKRGLLEVWGLQNGKRVSAFNVDPRGRLITLSGHRDGVLGTPPDEEAVFRQNISTAAFVNPDGQIYNILAPFRLAALGTSEATVHDESLLKEFKADKVSKDDDLDIEKLVSFIQELRTFTIRRKCIELVIKSKTFKPFTIAKAITRLMELYGIQDSKNTSTDSHSFLVFLQMLDRILRLYILLRNYYSENVIETPDECIESLKLYETEVDSLALSLLIEASKSSEMVMPKFPSLKVFIDQFDILSTSATFLKTAQVISGNLCFQPKNEDAKLAVLTAIFAPFIFGEVDLEELEAEVLPISGFSMEDIMEGLTNFWLSPANKHPISFVDRLVKLLRRFQKELNRQTLGSLEGHIKASENVSAGLFFLLSIRALQRWDAADRKVAAGVEEGVDAFDVDDQWEQMDEYIEYCELLSQNLLILTLFSNLPGAPKVSLNGLAEKGVGYYREQIGSWVAVALPSVEDLMGSNEGEADTTLTVQILQALKKHLPLSLKLELLLADASWECANAWFKDESRRVTRLTMATKFLEKLDKLPRLQHGLAFMLWETFIQQPFQHLYNFLNFQDGRFPRDREARKELYVAETDLYELICAIERVLRCLVYAVVDLDQHPQIPLKYEDFIERFMDYVNLSRSTKVNRQTLVELAGKQKSINYHLTLHHIHLIVAIKLQYLCSVQIIPKSLFDPIGHRAFFEPFHSHPLIPLARVEVCIKNKRQTFLEECIQNVATNADSDSQHLWQLVMELADGWQLDTDSLRIKEIVMFYENGMDSEAEHVSSAVTERKQLAFQLLPVIVNRLRYFFNEDASLYGVITRKSLAQLSTIDYIKGFNDNPLPSHDVDTERVRRLIRFVNNLLLQAAHQEATAKLRILRDLESINDFISHNISS